MNAFEEVRTARLCLRTWQDSDLQPFSELNADVVAMQHFPRTLSRAESDDLVDRIRAHWHTHGFGYWAVERLEDQAFVGFVGLSRPSFSAHFTPCIEVGWRLRREQWGQGYATEAAREALRLGFAVLGAAEIVALTVPANTGSLRVMERLGMSRDAKDDFDHPRIEQGNPLQRHVLYRIRSSAMTE